MVLCVFFEHFMFTVFNEFDLLGCRMQYELHRHGVCIYFDICPVQLPFPWVRPPARLTNVILIAIFSKRKDSTHSGTKTLPNHCVLFRSL